MRRVRAFHLSLLALPFVLALATGCVVNPPPRTETRTVYVVRQPPKPRVEAMSKAPGHNHVWVEGHYRWHRNDYVWVPGHWEKIPKGRKHRVAGHWAHDRAGWYWVDGYWR